MLTVVVRMVAVVVLLVAVLLQAWFYNWKVELIAQRSGPIDASRRRRQSPRSNSNGSRLMDGQIQRPQARAIPIGRAMELVAAELAAREERRTADERRK